MRHLLDTQAIIWYFEDSKNLPHKMVEEIDNPENNVFISSVSLWEIAIKISIGKLDLKYTLEELLAVIKTSDFDILQIESEYLILLSTLPIIHKDPFDRLLISSAKAEGLVMITSDEDIKKYDLKWAW